jgi:hypothetical protein
MNKPVGVREIQRALNLSSPSVARYHISKLEDAGIIKRVNGNYMIARADLKHTVRISRFLVPRHLFYVFFAVLVLVVQLVFFRPMVVTSGYFFAVMTAATFALIFSYETVRTWLNDSP